MVARRKWDTYLFSKSWLPLLYFRFRISFSIKEEMNCGTRVLDLKSWFFRIPVLYLRGVEGKNNQPSLTLWLHDLHMRHWFTKLKMLVRVQMARIIQMPVCSRPPKHQKATNPSMFAASSEHLWIHFVYSHLPQFLFLSLYNMHRGPKWRAEFFPPGKRRRNTGSLA